MVSLLAIWCAHLCIDESNNAVLNYVIKLLQLKSALADVLSQQGAKAPQRVRFFRGQMQTIISRALTDLDIKPVPSRRCFALIGGPRGASKVICSNPRAFWNQNPQRRLSAM